MGGGDAEVVGVAGRSGSEGFCVVLLSLRLLDGGSESGASVRSMSALRFLVMQGAVVYAEAPSLAAMTRPATTGSVRGDKEEATLDKRRGQDWNRETRGCF